MKQSHHNKDGADIACQRGALLFITPLLMLLVVLLSVMALDGARLYSQRKAMQSEVNAAATAAADATQTCGGQDISLDSMKARALTAAEAQGFNGTANDLNIQAGVLEDAAGDGKLAFRSTANLDESNAVRVSYKRQARISMLLPESALGGVTLSVNAAVRKQAVATISAAGSTADVGGGLLGSLLGAVLGGGSAYNLDPTSLSSLENTTVKLGDLLDAAGVNDVAALLPLSGQQLANALSTVARNRGVAGVTGLLDDLATANGIDTIKVSDVLDVVGNTAVPPNSQFPLYDTVISLVLNIAKSQQAGSDGVIDVPLSISNLSLGPLASIKTVDLKLHIGEPPTVAIGPARKGADGNWKTRFYAPDITLQLRAQVELLSLNLGLADLSIADLDVPLAVAVGGGHGDFIAADCARGSVNDAEITVQLHREVARIATGEVQPGTGQLEAKDLDVNIGRISLLFGLFKVVDPAIHLQASLDTTVPGVDQSVTLDPRYPLYCSPGTGCETENHQDKGDGLSGLDLNLKITDLKLLGLNLGGLLQGVIDTLQPLLNTVVNTLAQTVINPLLKTLGVGLGGISVTVSNVDQSSIQLIENVPVVPNGR